MSTASGRVRGALLRSAALLCTLLIGSGALELHNRANHHRAIEIGGLVETAGAHPRIPHHFDRSEELREPACATCALQAHSRGVRPLAAGAVAPAESCRLQSAPENAVAVSATPSSASPRGPPAA
jgi:hypothetical protein